MKQWMEKLRAGLRSSRFVHWLTPVRAAVLVILAACLLAALVSCVVFGGGSRVELPGSAEQAGHSTKVEESGYTLTDADITTDNVQSVISSLTRPEAYSEHIKNTVYWDGDWNSMEADRYVLNGTSLTQYYDADGAQSRCAVLRGTLYFAWRSGESDYYIGKAGEWTADAASMLPTYEDVARLDADSITDAGLRTLNDSPCIYVTTEDANSGYTLTYWISPVNGLLVQADYTKKKELVRSVEVTDVFNTEPEASLFQLPDGQSALTATQKQDS